MDPEYIRKRELALEWWKNLSDDKRIEYYYEYKKEGIFISYYSNLTGFEIQTIWANRLCLEAYGRSITETTQEDINFITRPENHIPKQQLPDKVDESMFKSYINQFTDQERLKMLKILVNSIPL